MRTFLMLLLWSPFGVVLADPAALLVYQVWESGIEPYTSRILVNDDHVRLDEGGDGGGYTLFDRRQEILYTVSVRDRAILVMNPPFDLPGGGGGLILQEEVEEDPAAPTVAGVRPKHVRLLANGELCSELVVLEGVMPEAVEALAELKRVLARIQRRTLDAVPLGQRDGCDLAANVYAADRSLRFGLPLQERSSGRSQSLVDFVADYEAPAALFTLPEAFARRAILGPEAI